MQAVPLNPDHDAPAEPHLGLAARRERLWGAVGGILGTAFGLGSATIAVFVEGAPLASRGPFPPFFAEPRLLAFDAFLAVGLLLGVGFLGAALVFARRGRYPRSDAFGAGLVGTVLSALAGSLVFARLVAVIVGHS